MLDFNTETRSRHSDKGTILTSVEDKNRLCGRSSQAGNVSSDDDDESEDHVDGEQAPSPRKDHVEEREDYDEEDFEDDDDDFEDDSNKDSLSSKDRSLESASYSSSSEAGSDSSDVDDSEPSRHQSQASASGRDSLLSGDTSSVNDDRSATESSLVDSRIRDQSGSDYAPSTSRGHRIKKNGDMQAYPRSSPRHVKFVSKPKPSPVALSHKTRRTPVESPSRENVVSSSTFSRSLSNAWRLGETDPKILAWLETKKKEEREVRRDIAKYRRRANAAQRQADHVEQERRKRAELFYTDWLTKKDEEKRKKKLTECDFSAKQLGRGRRPQPEGAVDSLMSARRGMTFEVGL